MKRLSENSRSKETHKMSVQYDIIRGRHRARMTAVLLDGSTRRITGYGDTDRAALSSLKEKLNELNKEIMYGIQKEDGDITLAEAVSDIIAMRRSSYDREKGRESIRDTTSKRDEDVYKALLLPHPIAAKKLNNIFVPDCAEYRRWLGSSRYDASRTNKPHEPVWKYYSTSTLNRIIRLVAAALDEYYGRTPHKSPSSALSPFKSNYKPKKEDDFLVGEEVTVFLGICRQKRHEARYKLDATYADLFIVDIMSGLRPGESYALEARDFDPDRGCLYIQRTGAYSDGRTKTAESMDSVYLVPEARAIISNRCQGLSENDRIFPNTIGGLLSPSNVSRKLKEWLKEAGIEKVLHPHSLRGSCASFMFDNGAQAEDVMIQLRHTQVDTTMRYYIARGDKRKQDIRDRMADIFASADKT